MSLTHKRSNETAINAARRRWNDGKQIFLFRCAAPGPSIRSVSDDSTADLIESVEEIGWHLDSMPIATDGIRLLFRRPFDTDKLRLVG
jgi:hypothetical protein